ncbi:MAG: GTPase ObgE [bacterium]|nr:GTPase ObgE [bacterium]
MAFIDELDLHLKSGNGGDGVVRWRHEKGKELSGPSGGNGGRGADFYVRAVRDNAILARYRNDKEFTAENGEAGMKESRHGKDGEDYFLDLPIGAIITNKNTGRVYSLEKDGETVLILHGGKGGLGNEYFKSSTNRSPEEFTEGKKGDEADFYIELELSADAGLAGFPNAGKSSILNTLTNASAKVGAYPFTTLEPNLGDLFGFVLADIPGLIEGASEGKGLGHNFLRHIKRTKMIVHCISLEHILEGKTKDLVDAYKAIRKELEVYSDELAKKKEVVVLTKTDLVDEKQIKSAVTAMKKYCDDVFTMSIVDDKAIKEFGDGLVKILRKLD